MFTSYCQIWCITNKEDAVSFEKDYLVQHNAHARSVLSEDTRTLKDLVALWFKYHGLNLADGECRRRCLLDMATGLGIRVKR